MSTPRTDAIVVNLLSFMATRRARGVAAKELIDPIAYKPAPEAVVSIRNSQHLRGPAIEHRPALNVAA